MEAKKDWDKTDLKDYLLYEFWKPEEACAVLAGCFSTKKKNTVYGTTARQTSEEKALLDANARLRRLWLSRGQYAPYEKHPPAYFIEWARSNGLPPDWLNWAIKRGLYDPEQETKKPLQDAPDAEGGDVPVKTPAVAISPWLIADPKDPKPEQPWYTPARYFARQLIKDDSTMLTKRNLLAKKIGASLSGVEIYKRGGKLPIADTTILKALTNVSLG